MLDLEKFLDFMNHDTGFNGHNGIRFTVLEEGYAECEVELGPESLNPQGVAHGSLLFLLCDCVTGMASASLDRNMLTQSSDIHFLRPAMGTKLTAKSVMRHIGRSTALFGAEVYDDQGRLCCTGDFSVFYTGGRVTWEERR